MTSLSKKRFHETQEYDSSSDEATAGASHDAQEEVSTPHADQQVSNPIMEDDDSASGINLLFTLMVKDESNLFCYRSWFH